MIDFPELSDFARIAIEESIHSWQYLASFRALSDSRDGWYFVERDGGFARVLHPDRQSVRIPQKGEASNDARLLASICGTRYDGHYTRNAWRIVPDVEIRVAISPLLRTLPFYVSLRTRGESNWLKRVWRPNERRVSPIL